MPQLGAAARPSAPRARMAGIRQSSTWGSALSTQEFAAIEGAGFDPVGQVLGTAVFHIGYAGRWGCSGAWSFLAGTAVSSSAYAPGAELVAAEPAGCPSPSLRFPRLPARARGIASSAKPIV